MLYELKDKDLLPSVKLGDDQAPARASFLWGNLLKSIVEWVVRFPSYVIHHLRRDLDFVFDRQSGEERREEESGNFSYADVQIGASWDKAGETLVLKMNYDGLKSFALGFRKVLADPQLFPTWTRLRSLTKGSGDDQEEPLYCTSPAEFFRGDFPYPVLSLGHPTSGLVEMHGGDELWAPVHLWIRICDEWIDVADRRRPALIVLDSYQVEWCDPSSTGRFMIEYIPEWD
jgi:hypothetical protein